MKQSADLTRSWIALLRTANTIKKSLDQQFRMHYGISISRFDVLSVLQRGNRNGLRAGDLSRQLIVSDGNTTQIVSKLVRDGLVLRRTDPKDARAVNFSLSDEGAALFTRMVISHREWLKEAFGDISEDKIHELHDLLQLLPPQNIVEKEDAA